MNKTVLLTILIFSLLLAGCGKTDSTNPSQQNTPSNATSTAIDYSQYVKKTWIKKDANNNPEEKVPSRMIRSYIKKSMLLGTIKM